jgi:hypothetical protein
MASLVLKLLRPVSAFRRIRELGIGKLASEFLVRRWRIVPVDLVGPLVRLARIALHPYDYLWRRRVARHYVGQFGNPLRIPEHAGYRLLSPDEVPGSREVLQLCQQILRERRGVLESYPDRYGINLLATDGLSWTREALDLRQFDSLLDFALSPPLLAAAAEYVGEIPALTSVQLYCTTSRQTMAGNNFFHFDKDRRMVSLWMAVNDIDEDKGPFTFFPATQSQIVREKIGYYGRLRDEQVYSAVPVEERIEFKGPAGSMLLVDTCRCVHFGSRTRVGPRVMLLLQYKSNFPWFETTIYYHPVLHNAARYAENPVARKVFAQLRERPAGRK